MGLYKKFKTSSDLETQGITLDLGVLRVGLRRAGGTNQPYNAAVARLAKQHGRAIQNDLLEDDRAKRMLYEVYADTVITSWETKVGPGDDDWLPGIEAPDGGDLLPFTRDNVIATLNNLPDLFIEFKNTAEGQQFYRAELLEATAKN